MLTQKPIIFYFNKELEKSEKETHFYKDIKHVGILAKSIPDIKKKHIILSKRERVVQKRISRFKKKIFPENKNFVKNFYSFFNNKYF